jgi:ligand-binding sensor domain-containing protein/serine phosphatase RsbU (regulator of sigma subunit)
MLKIILFYSALCLAFSLSAQTYDFKKYDDEKINSLFVYDIKQDNNGYLYLATSNGLIKYDGVHFNVFNTDRGITDNFIEHLEIDNKQNVWFSYYNGGYGYLNESTIFNLSDDAIVTDIKIKDSNQVFICHQNEIVILKDEKRIDSINIDVKQLEFISNAHFLRLDFENRLYNVNTKNENFLLLTDIDFLTTSYNDNLIFTINNNILNIHKLKPNQTLQKIDEIDLSKYNLDITSLYYSNHNLEISSSNKGILEIKFNSDLTSFTSKTFNITNGLHTNYVYTTFIDKEQNLWIGSYGEGLYMLPYSRIATYKLNKENITQIINFENTLYIGTNEGLIKMSSASNTIGQTYLPQKHITSLVKYKDTLYIGTKSNGLYTLKNNNLKAYKIPNLNLNNSINHLQFNDNNLILATNSGLFIYNIKSKTTQIITTNEGMAHNIVEYFIIDHNKRFWFESPNSPIYCYENGEFIYYKNVEGYNSFNITDIKEDSEHNIWIATAGDGVFKYTNKTFTQFTTEQGLYSNYLYFISLTNNNSLTIGHKEGLSVINYHDSISISNIGYVKELEYILPRASYFAGEKNLWIGTNNGLVNLHADFILNKSFVPNLYIEKLIINKDTLKNESIHLPYNNYYIEIYYKAIKLSNPKSISYKFKLEGFDKNWTTVDYNTNVARYQSISDGEYVFKLKLLNNNIETHQEIYIYITIAKPYWKEAWFYVALFFLLVFIMIGIIIYINRRNYRLRKKLALKVEERTRDLKKLTTEYLKEKEIAEHQSREIMKSINYSTRIQKGMLRKGRYLKWFEFFKTYFLIFKPKDKVSGDFYWGHKIKDELYIAVGDCTGHGVPGAMISMLGVTSLNEIINQTFETDEILNNLRHNIILQLGQSNQSIETMKSRDGMDIVILRYNIKTKKAQSSSALNPLYIVREKTKHIDTDCLKIVAENDELYILSTTPDKFPVGLYDNLKPFRKTDFQLYENDHIYLFSDGYYDQFGGPKNKKFLKKRFHALLLKIYGLPGDEQKKILWETLQDWMQDYEQIDDISILGLVVDK